MNRTEARQILDLEAENPSTKDIKDAYKRKMREEHPDRLPKTAAFKALSLEAQAARLKEATEQSKRVNEAYTLLSSPDEGAENKDPFQYQNAFYNSRKDPWGYYLSTDEIKTLRASIISMLHAEEPLEGQSKDIFYEPNIQRFNQVSELRGCGTDVNMAWMRALHNALFCVFFVDALDQNTIDILFNLVEQKAHPQLMIEVPIYCALQARLTQLGFAMPDFLCEPLTPDTPFADMSFGDVQNRFAHVQDLKLALNILCYTPEKKLSESNIQGIGFDIEPSRALNEAYYPYFLEVCNQVPKAITTYAYFMCKVVVADISDEQKHELLEKGRNSIPSDFSLLNTSHLFICKAQAILQANPNDEGYQGAISLHEELHASQSLQL